MENSAIEIKKSAIDCFSQWDASIQVDWIIGRDGEKVKRTIGFVGFWCEYTEKESSFRNRVLKAYDELKKAYEYWPIHSGHIDMEISFQSNYVSNYSE